ncbi:helix-turn-helix domain-containing protein [Saccharothrix texasensis]|uniref:HTH cro/C1-type domain-containing protein n=1 Tax=Saccharothrix texasensis TaxID=103734 RepID=A0A3N1H1J4_9PSEU|nr:helix-turn-helix transcriptional regulator [Saccharothrix texasensis]ROP36276.1 hypothetical protein EDD40_1541 [Saccharothrix texasensis]
MSDRITVISDVIAAAIREHRKKRGLTRDELATELWDVGAPQSMSAAVVGYIETGRRDKDGQRRREVTADELVLIAAALSTPVRDLLGEHAEKFGFDDAPPCTECAERRRRGGQVLAQAREDVEDMGELDEFEGTLAAALFVVAEAVDNGHDKLPQLVKELRELTAALMAGRAEPPPEEDDLDDAGEPD